ncbi:MAG: N-acylglucosamine 2-epimerase [Gemmatimonadetes bacterium]|nr:N-acylglucosamine 2-epimerase [Gemmatimonadota bacterium]
MLREFGERYRLDLTERVIPFWYEHSLDRECGGYFTCLDRDGTVYDTKKYMWLQGREVWMFSRFYNELERKQEYLDAATLGLEFIRAHGRDPQGRLYFSLTREGRPFFYQRKPYAAVFYMAALLEYYKATGERDCLEESKELFWLIVEWIENPELLDRPPMDGAPAMSSLANVMVLASMAIELIQVEEDPRYRQVMADAINGAKRHCDAERRILVENALLEENAEVAAWPEGRFFNPGHSIEVAWFLLHLLEYVPDGECEKMALDVLEGSLEFGWDREFGGLSYCMDLEGKPTLQLESSMKLWWPHTESIYALVLAYCRTGEERWLEWLEKVDAYTYEHFVDEEYGGWFGYCDRRGNLTHTCKGGNYKGFFHVPRALLMSVQQIERMDK